MGERQILLTRRGLERLERELEKLRVIDRKEVADRIRASKDSGFEDNSDLESAKAQQAFVEGRIMEIENILTRAYLLDTGEVPCDRVTLGCRVKLREARQKDPIEFVIVSPIEADPSEGMISNESPVGRALIGREIGEIVEVIAPKGKTRYRILDISV
jgi:transcription elongation factor GreA